MQRWIGLSILFILTSLSLQSQSDFFSVQEKIFSRAASQWMCDELQRVNPAHFDCASAQHHWTFPATNKLILFGENVTMTADERNRFSTLYLPGGDCKRYLRLLSLCDLYFPLFRKKAEAKGLPREYQLLPLLISGCNPTHQGERDDAGLWSMDYLTARRQHLRIDTLVDERRGGDFSTDAALEYLSFLSDKYNHDPFITITAYLRGVPYVSSTDTSLHGAAYIESLDPYMQLFFKCYAYTNALITSTRTDNQLNNSFDIFGQMEAVVFEQTTNFNALEEIVQPDMRALHQINAVYTGQYIEPGYRRVPFLMDKLAALKFEALKDSVYRWQPKPTIIPPLQDIAEETVIRHKVKRGESLGKIASKYGVSVRQIKTWNNLRSDKISKGKVLVIHKPGKKNIPVPVADHPNQPETKQPEVKQPEVKPFESKQPETPKSTKNKVSYTVKSGDSLWKIAKRYKGVTEQDIMKWNKCSADIRPGQKLIIYPSK